MGEDRTHNIVMVNINSPNVIRDQDVINVDLKQPFPGLQNMVERVLNVEEISATSFYSLTCNSYTINTSEINIKH